MMQYLIALLFISAIATNDDYSQTNYALLENTNSLNVTLYNYEQVIWLLNVSIGYPSEYFNVQLDTGSNALWVPLDNCRFCSIDTRYNPSGQSSYAPNGSTGYLYYGGGEASGLIATDLVSLVGTAINDTFTMLFATYETGFADTNVFDGIMGVSNNQSYQNIFQVAYSNGQIDTELYAVALNQAPLTSYLLYGTIDSSLLSDAIWVTPDDIYRWKLFINSFTVNGVDYSAYMETTTSAILDTGTTMLTLTPQLYEVMLKDFFVPAGCTVDEGIYCPCAPSTSQLASMPNITVAFNMVNVTIPYMNMLQYFYDTDEDYCELMVSFEEGANFMVFGDPALMSFIPIFNKTANSIGIVGGVANGIPNGNYTGDDEIDEAMA